MRRRARTPADRRGRFFHPTVNLRGRLQFGLREPTVTHDAIPRRRGITDERSVWVLILPAIDLRGGQCVRLRQGDYAQETVFGADPAAMARRWVEQGATYLHLVDLDGAREGQPVNGDSVRAIVGAAGVPCQLGGGLRTEADIDEALGWGVDARRPRHARLTRSRLVSKRCVGASPARSSLGIDAKEGRVAAEGWLQASGSLRPRPGPASAPPGRWPPSSTPTSAATACWRGRTSRRRRSWPRPCRVPVIASGGVTTLDDVRRLARRRAGRLHHRPGAVRRAARSS